MNAQEIQRAIAELPPGEQDALMEWIEEYRADAWDRQIARDAEAGRFEALRQRVREQREAGQYRPCSARVLDQPTPISRFTKPDFWRHYNALPHEENGY